MSPVNKVLDDVILVNELVYIEMVRKVSAKLCQNEVKLVIF